MATKQWQERISFVNVQRSYPPGEQLNIGYTINAELKRSTRDWVGLFRVGWSSSRDYYTFEWALFSSKTEDNLKGEVTFAGRRLPPEDNHIYQFCYVTSDGRVQGASTPFQFSAVTLARVDDLELVEVGEESLMISQPRKREEFEAIRRNESLKSEKEKLVKQLADVGRESEAQLKEINEQLLKKEANLREKDEVITELERQLVWQERIGFINVQRSYPSGEQLNIGYTINAELKRSTRDWVGLFRVGWSSSRDYYTFEWALFSSKTEDNLKGEVTFAGRRLPPEDNHFYQFRYVTSDGRVQGASTPFQFLAVSLARVDDLELVEVGEESLMIVGESEAELQLLEKEAKLREKDEKFTELELERQLVNHGNDVDKGKACSKGHSVELNWILERKPCGELLVLGSGSYGKVYKGYCKNSGNLLAAKVVLDLTQKAADDLEKEVKQLSKLSPHERVVTYLGACYADHPRFKEKCLYVFTEYMPGGSLASCLEKYGAFTQKLTRSYTRQILEGVEYLHECKVIHRDIKGSNIMCDTKGNIKLADFGSAKQVCTETLDKDKTKYLCGTAPWAAPEVLRGKKAQTQSDIWSVAATVVEMLTGAMPYKSEKFDNSMAIIFQVGGDTKLNPLKSMKRGGHERLLTDDVETFLSKCFNRESKERPSATVLLTNFLFCKH